MVVEAMCEGYCHSHGGKITANKKGRKPEFMNYVNCALGVSKLTAQRKKHWRLYFNGVRVLRNKVSHFDPYFTDHEKGLLIEAGLGAHVGLDGMIKTRPANYVSLAERVLNFIQELELQ
jgi:hypothetical protein